MRPERDFLTVLRPKLGELKKLATLRQFLILIPQQAKNLKSLKGIKRICYY
jgi:hypothetical protein